VTPEKQLESAVSHHQAGRFAEAEKIYRQLLAQNPANADALQLLGALAGQTGRLPLAAELISRAVAISPANPFFHANLGNAQSGLGRLDDAIASYRKAIELNPDFAEAHHNLGNALLRAGRNSDAIPSFRHAILLRPDLIEAHQSLGNALRAAGSLNEAIAAYRQVIHLAPNHPAAHNNLGIALQNSGQLQESLASFRRAVQIRPDYIEAHINIGNALYAMGEPDQAIASHRRAVQIDPNNPHSLTTLAGALLKEWKLEEPEKLLRKALELNPKLPDAHWNLAVYLLLHGDYERGWPEYEWRWPVISPSKAPPQLSKPLWDGSLLNGRTILLLPEQGYGDAIQFARYIPLLKRQGAHVNIVCRPALARLFEMAGADQTISAPGEFPPCDVYLPILSLAWRCKTTLQTIPFPAGYIVPDPAASEAWRNRLAKFPGKKIGIVWSGSTDYQDDKRRSMKLSYFAPLAQIPGVTLVSLQKQPESQAPAVAPSGIKLIDFTPELSDFVDTANLIAALDLVISVDTAVAHLAGAIGKPIWILLSRPGHWLWLLDRTDTPWYDSMKLFRQKTPGDWHELISRVTQNLRDRLSGSAD
jgi:tetratricopeptide (TPR) repeat protein